MTDRFDIVWVRLDSTIGKEIKKTRPCVIISPHELNHTLATIIVVPLTSTIKNWPFRLKISHRGSNSSMAFDQTRAISKSRIIKKDGILSKADSVKALNIPQTMFAD